MKNRKAWLIALSILLLAGLLFIAGYYLAPQKYVIDYSDPARWVSLPAQADKPVDVFYLYPTAWKKAKSGDPNICNIDNPSMLKGAKAAFARQATAFEPVGNIYAPYYRQADAKSTLAMAPDKRNQVIGDVPLSDALAAFEYYLKHYNKGRPFILASHSQGSNVMTFILSGYLKSHPLVYKRMVAAYVIGYSVTGDYLAQNPHLKFAKGADDVGVIISYNTEAPSVAKGVNPVVLPGALVINPITWTREETQATKEQGLGSFMPNIKGEFGPVPQIADARIDKEKGALICSPANQKLIAAFVKLGGFPDGVYHSFDYPFYYFNIRENAADRVKTYLSQQTAETTLQRTIVAAEKPTKQIQASELAKYKENGYGVWNYGPGLKAETRLDLMPAGYVAPGSAKKEQLLNFFTMSDIHITDKESPNQLIYLQQLNPKVLNGLSLYSPVMLSTTQVLDAAVQTVNALNKKTPLDFGLSLGDAANSTQNNEVRWFIDVLDGKVINPSSGEHLGASNIDYQKPFKAAGLDKSIPWYQVLGNHDHFYIGSISVDYGLRKDLRNTYTSGDIFAAGDVFQNPANIAKEDYYMGTINGSTPYGDIMDAGPVASFQNPPKVVADPARRSLVKADWLKEFSGTTSSPAGHGFGPSNSKEDFACYSFVPKKNLPLKVIALDDTQNENDGSSDIHGHGFLDKQRWEWLKKELADGDVAGQLMIIAAHIPIGVEANATTSEVGWWQDPQNACTYPELVEELQKHPNLVMWLSGHRHTNVIKAFLSPDAAAPERGFWEVETSSLRDFPQEFRTFQINLSSDDTLSIAATDVDPAVKVGTPAWKSRSYALAVAQLYNQNLEKYNPTNDPTIKPTPGGSYNAVLIKKLTPAMAKKLRKK